MRRTMQFAVLIHFKWIKGRLFTAAAACTHHGQRAHINHGFKLKKTFLHSQVLLQQLFGTISKRLNARFHGRSMHGHFGRNTKQVFNTIQTDTQCCN